jgi:ribosome biogenesis GTPase
LIGQSGVGKSSLFRALGGDNVVGEVSKIGRGRQTTTSARLHRFSAGFLIDSPGVGEFEVRDRPWPETARGFVEFAALPGDCRFRDCSHRNEPDCKVKAGLLGGGVEASRYESYRTIVDRA